MNAGSPLVEFSGASVVFDGQVRALDDVTLAIRRGEIAGLVGESGSGKSTLCRSLMGLVALSSGTVNIGGEPVYRQLAQDPLAFRRRAQMLLQDAVASLSPRMTIGHALEGLGFPGVKDVRAGKVIELDLAETDAARAEAAAREMCEKLLANTIIENYRVEIV